MSIDHTRHIGIFHAINHSATIIGSGGIGAITAIALAKMGLGRIVVADNDNVDDVNIATQFHKFSDIGKPKVLALKNSIEEFANMRVETIHGIISENTVLPETNIIISGVDSINSRKGIWKAVIKRWSTYSHYSWYIDARMAAEYLQLFVVNNKSATWYDQALSEQSDDQIPNDPCTSKATIYTACIAAGEIGSVVRRIVTGRQAQGILTYDILYRKMNWIEV